MTFTQALNNRWLTDSRASGPAPDTLAGVAELVDERFCLDAPAYSRAVGQFYQYFDQLEDDEVIELLKKILSQVLVLNLSRRVCFCWMTRC